MIAAVSLVDVSVSTVRNHLARGMTRLRAELKDLREGLEMVEEKARGELGLIEPDEIFVPLQK